MTLFQLILSDIEAKAHHAYFQEERPWAKIVKTLLSEGLLTVILYRFMQACHKARLKRRAWNPLWFVFLLWECIFNKAIVLFCHCVIGRGANFGPGLVFAHAFGIIVHTGVVGGKGITIHQDVTIGEGVPGKGSPRLGDNILIGSGAKLVGKINIENEARINVGAIVTVDVPAFHVARAPMVTIEPRHPK